MNKKLTTTLPVFFLLLVTLTACGRAPAAAPGETQAQVPLPRHSNPRLFPKSRQKLPSPQRMSRPLLACEKFRTHLAAGSYQFAEGPATDASGNVYFSDIMRENL